MSFHDILASICPVTLWIFTAIHLIFIIFFIYFFVSFRKITFILCSLISFGLFYDSLILSIGTIKSASSKDSSIFCFFSQIRFISHGALIPLLFSITALVLQKNMKKVIFNILIGLTVILIILGIAEGCATKMEYQTVANINRFTLDNKKTQMWAKIISYILSYGAVAPLIIGGIFDWIKNKTPMLFLSGITMFIFAAIGPGVGCTDLIFFITMFGEISMMLFLLLRIYLPEKSLERNASDIDALIEENSENAQNNNID